MSGAFSLTLILCLCAPAAADTWFVDADLVTGNDDGTSWADAFQGPLGLQSALAVAVAGDQVFVAQGTYLATNTGSRSISFALKDDVELYGSFLGGETDPDDRPPFGTAPSVLSGDLAGDDGSGQFGDNTFHIIRTAGTTASAVLDGFVVSSGAATGVGGNNDRGGGILCLGAGSSPTVRNCNFISNRAAFGGGAGYINSGAAPTFTDCTFEDGVGGSFGGAFDVAAGGPVRFERCGFFGNMAQRAGALEIFSTTGAVVNNCVFIGNASLGAGGGGGLWIGSGGDSQVRNCTIVANFSIVNDVAGLRIQNAANASAVNCILWDNTGPLGAQASGNQVNPGADVTWSIVEGGFVGPGNLASDPLLVDISSGDVTPTAASPGIDAGNNAEVPAGTTLDLAQKPRFADVLTTPDTGVGEAPIVDIGALEFPSVWVDLGHALAGTAGEPKLILSGPLTGGSQVDVSLSGAIGFSTAWLVIGFDLLMVPFKGGIMVPDVDFLTPFGTTVLGTVDFSGNWPPFVPPGFETWWQFWIVDSGGPKGFSASNAVKGTTP